MKFYLAGKVSKNCWRHTLVRDLRDAMALDGGCEESTRLPRRFPVMTDAVDGGHDYVGPCFVGCDHGCYHGHNTHGLAYMGAQPSGHGADAGAAATKITAALRLGSRRRQIRTLCLRAIDDCDVLYAWIDSTDAYGTYSEIGWAAARQKTVWLAGPREFTDLWFVYQLAGLALFNQADALTGFRALRSVAAGKATLADFEPATDKQRAYLLSLGAPGERVDAVTKRQAQQLIGELRARRLGKERRRGLS